MSRERGMGGMGREGGSSRAGAHDAPSAGSVSRRDLLKSAAAAPLIGSGASMFRWLPGGEDRCLLVLELVGGNDGLNTIIPIQDGDRRARLQRRAHGR